MLFIYDDDKRSYCGKSKSLLPFGLRRRRAVCFTSAPPRWMASPSSPMFASQPGGARKRTSGTSTTGCQRHAAIGAGDPADQEADGCEKVQSAGRRRVRDKRERGVCGPASG